MHVRTLINVSALNRVKRLDQTVRRSGEDEKKTTIVEISFPTDDTQNAVDSRNMNIVMLNISLFPFDMAFLFLLRTDLLLLNI